MDKELLTMLEEIKTKADGTIKKTELDAILEAKEKAFEQKILQLIPKQNEALPLHQLAGQDYEQIKKGMKFLLTHKAPEVSANPALMAEAKAMGVGIGSAGGFLVPTEFRAEVLRKLVKQAVIRPNATEFTGVGLKGELPRETGTVDLTWETENVASTESTNPTLGQIVWNLNELRGLTKFSMKLINSSAIDVVGILSDMFAEQMMTKEETAFMNGTGSNQPLGLRTNVSGMGTLAQAGANLAYVDIVKIKHKLKSQYRAGAVWLIHNDILSLIARIVDTQGRPIFLDISNMGGQGTNRDIPANTIGFLLGNPVLEQNDIPVTLGGGSNESEIWYVDLKRAYKIFDAGVMEMANTTEGFNTFESNQMAIRVISYVDGKAGIPEGAAFLTGVK